MKHTSFSHPRNSFCNPQEFTAQLSEITVVEFGNRFYQKAAHNFELKSEAQPSFNKNFDLITADLDKWQDAEHVNVVCADNYKQLERLREIFSEIDPLLTFESVTASLRAGFIDKDLKVTCYTDHQLFDRFHRYKTKDKSSKSKALTLKELKTLQPGDFVVHIDYGVGRFAGLDKVDVGGHMQEAMRLIYKDDDLLYLSIHSLHKISRFSGKEGGTPLH